MKYQAIIVDLDRTLLRTDKTISKYTLRILRTCQQIGIRLFAATARPERAITMYQKILDFDAVTTLNGARTITKDAVYENFISRPSAESVLNQLRQTKNMIITVEAETAIYANKENPLWMPVVTDRIHELPAKEKIYKILANHPSIPASQITVDLPDETYSTIADKRFVQVMSKSATKWLGVQKMLEAYQIDAAKAIYFGDDNDDVEPIRHCGCGVAMSNALDHVKAAADYVTESNDDDGVVRFLAKQIS